MIALLTLTKCCFVLSLRKGVILISLADFFGAICGLGISSMMTIQALKEMNNLTAQNSNYSLSELNSTDDESKNVFFGVHIFQSIVSLLLIIMSVILFFGVIKEKPFILLIWLLYSTIHTIAMSFSIILTTVNHFKVGSRATGYTGCTVFILIAVVTWYNLSVVFCYYIEVRDGSPACTIIKQQDSKNDGDNMDSDKKLY